MKSIVCGCGKIGSTILAALVAEGHDLVALDDDPAVRANRLALLDLCNKLFLRVGDLSKAK